MRQKLIAKFLPAQYRQEAFIEFHNFRQRGMSVEQYTSEFDMLRRRCDIVEEKEQISRGGSVANQWCFKCQGLGHLIADCPNRQLITLVEEDVVPVYDDYEDYDEGLEDHLTEGEEIRYADFGESLVVRSGIAEAIILATDEIAGHVAVQGQPEDISTVDFPTCESSRMSQKVDKTGEGTLAVVTKADKAPEGLIGKVTADEVKLLGKLQDGTIFVKNGHDEEEPFEFKIDEEQVVDGIDKAVKKMKKGEIALITIHPEYAFGANDAPQELAIVPSNSIVYFEVEMVSFVKKKESWDMNTQDKIEEAGKKKEEGNILFKVGKYVRASKRYEKAVNFIEYDSSFSDDEKQQARLLKVSCNLNNVACKLKLKEYKEAAKHCSKVLEIQSKNVKALYRRAQAYIQLVDLDLAELDIKKALEIVKKISDKLAANLTELNRLPQHLTSVAEALTTFMRILSSSKDSVGIFAHSHSYSGVAARACGLASLEPTKIVEVLKDRPSWFWDCRKVKVFTMFFAGSGGTVELLLIPSGYLIRPYDGGGPIIHIVGHLNFESWSAPEILRPLYDSSKDVGGTLVWYKGAANKFVSGIKILTIGSLVLHDISNQTVWQSYDPPTDALLPGQKLRAVNEIELALKNQLIISTALMTVGIAIVSWTCLLSSFTIFNFGTQKVVKNWQLFLCGAIGLWAGLIIRFVTEYYTSNAYSPVPDVADSCRTGAATNVLF